MSYERRVALRQHVLADRREYEQFTSCRIERTCAIEKHASASVPEKMESVRWHRNSGRQARIDGGKARPVDGFIGRTCARRPARL